MASHRHIVIGFQGSGKTTYAAALWHLVDARAMETPTVLAKGTHRGDYSYLEKIVAAWESGYQVARTGVGTWRSVAINLRSELVDGDIELSFVDMSGETFEQIFASREYDDKIEVMARGCKGLLLFVSAARKIDDVTLVDVGMAIPEDMPDEPEEDEEEEITDELDFGGHSVLGADTSSREEAEGGENEPETATPPEVAQPVEGAVRPGDFMPALTPRQIQIVDLLDALADAPVELRPARVAVIVSAWDLVATSTDPGEWLATKMPLLHQYLLNHADEFETRIYGVSAQGGRLPKREKPDEESDRAKLLEEPIAGRRIRVVGHHAGAHDLTHPIAWLSGLDK